MTAQGRVWLGLVRNLSFFDAISSNFAIINIASALTFPVLLIAFTFPHANIPLAILITVPPILAYNGLYSYFARAMPRSGALRPSTITVAATMMTGRWIATSRNNGTAPSSP